MGRGPWFGIPLSAEEATEIEQSGKKLLRLRSDYYMRDVRKKGDDYGWECGHIAPKKEFLRRNRCPNPRCPDPSNWNS